MAWLSSLDPASDSSFSSDKSTGGTVAAPGGASAAESCLWPRCRGGGGLNAEVAASWFGNAQARGGVLGYSGRIF